MPILSYFPSGGGGEVTITLPTVPSQKGELIYTGESLTPAWNDYDPETLTINGVLSATDAGSYVCVFTPRPGYCWDDKSLLPRNVIWSISKAEGSVTLGVSSISLDTVFNKTALIDVERKGTGVITALSSNSDVVSVYVDGNTLTATSKGAGSAVITVSVAEDTNYTSDSATVEVTSVNVWKKYSASHTLNHTLLVSSFECSVDELEDMEEKGEIYWDEDYDETIMLESGGSYPTGFRGYKSISVDSDGNIVAGTTSSSMSATKYVRYGYTESDACWYYVGDYDSSGKLYLFELFVLSEDVYSRGTYLCDVNSTLENAYPENGVYSDGFWYVRISEGFSATDDGDGNISIFNATVTEDGSGNLTIRGG